MFFHFLLLTQKLQHLLDFCVSFLVFHEVTQHSLGFRATCEQQESESPPESPVSAQGTSGDSRGLPSAPNTRYVSG